MSILYYTMTHIHLPSFTNSNAQRAFCRDGEISGDQRGLQYLSIGPEFRPQNPAVTLPSTVLSFIKEFVDGPLTIQYQKQNLYLPSRFVDIFVEELHIASPRSPLKKDL